jgi:hypothetical protein
VPEAASPLSAWESYYVIVGSSAAALTGLQFVVISLIKERRAQTSTREIDAFATPTVVHFGAVLLVSAILSAPWRNFVHAGILVGVTGLVGLIYGLLVVRRTRRPMTYKLVMEDWIWHVMLPLVAYGALFVPSLLIAHHAHESLFWIGTASVLLLFIGIHNAWDTVTYIATDQHEQNKSAK